MDLADLVPVFRSIHLVDLADLADLEVILLLLDLVLTYFFFFRLG
jgi:hypothetical protein